tara:strand:- start:186 stop:377 length:192 start_codon:yes stop_codon:yes gene_type:complete
MRIDGDTKFGVGLVAVLASCFFDASFLDNVLTGVGVVMMYKNLDNVRDYGVWLSEYGSSDEDY